MDLTVRLAIGAICIALTVFAWFAVHALADGASLRPGPDPAVAACLESRGVPITTPLAHRLRECQWPPAHMLELEALVEGAPAP